MKKYPAPSHSIWQFVMGRVEGCIAALTRWRDKVGGLDCEQIVGGADFDSVRADLSFQAFLEENGCTGGG